jgi:hypothetical protein
MQQTAEEGSARPFAIGDRCRSLASGGGKGSFAGFLARMLLTLLHLLHKRLGLFLVGERQARRAVLELESMEESAVLVV